MRHNKFSLAGQTGITLVEVLISLSIFSIGLLSLLHYSASSVKELSENNPRSMALDAATDSMVQIYIAANNHDQDTIKARIEALNNSGNGSGVDAGPYHYTVTVNSVKNGKDADGNDGAELLSNGSLDGNLASPLSLGLSVQFTDRTDPSKNVTVNVPFTIVF